LPGFRPLDQQTSEGVSVQPPVAVLENIVIIRIHLDDCDAHQRCAGGETAPARRGVLRSRADPRRMPLPAPLPSGETMPDEAAAATRFQPPMPATARAG
jgi:hypothetical protein